MVSWRKAVSTISVMFTILLAAFLKTEEIKNQIKPGKISRTFELMWPKIKFADKITVTKTDKVFLTAW